MMLALKFSKIFRHEDDFVIYHDQVMHPPYGFISA